MTKYLTEEQVKREARRSLKAAVRCSLRHWQELRDAPLKDLRVNCGPWANLCALCQRFIKRDGNCIDCPLNEMDENCFGTLSFYAKAYHFWKEYKKDSSLKNELNFRNKAQDMVTTLNHLLLKETKNANNRHTIKSSKNRIY